MDSRNPIFEYVFTMISISISWKIIIQKFVALSITEAEYITLTKVVKEVLWLKGFSKELKLQG